MADSWVPAIQDWTNGAVLTEAQLDTEVRDRMTAIFNALTADNSADSDIYHGHKSGTLASRPTAAHAGRTYYATDLGAQFIDNGTRWDVIGVNTRIAESFSDEFMLSNNAGSYTTLPAGQNWSPAVTVSGTFIQALSPGNSKLRMQTGATINSTVTLSNQAGGTHYLMDQASDRVPALLSHRYATVDTTDQTVLFGLADSGGATPNGIYWKRIDVGAVANWRGVCRNAGVQTDTTLAQLGDTAYHHFEIQIDSLTSVKFYIDGVQITPTCTTNIPTTTNLAFQHYITNAAAFTKRLDLDRIDWIAKR